MAATTCNDDTNWRSSDNRAPASRTTNNNRYYRTPIGGSGGGNDNEKDRREPLSPTLPEKYAFPSRVPAQHLLGKLAHPGMPFSTQLRLLTNEIILPTEDLHHRDLIVHNLERDLQEIFQGARLRLFGSSANAIGTRGSDMDAIAVLPRPPTLKLAEIDELLSPPLGNLQFREMRQMKRPLEPKFLALLTHSDLVVLLRKFLILKYWSSFNDRQRCEFSNIVAIYGARIPIVRLVYKSGLEVDISLSHDEHPLSLCNTGLLLLLASMDVRFKTMCIVLRRWQEEHCLTKGHGGLNNYALTLLVMNYLQHNNTDDKDDAKPVVLPALNDLACNIATIDAEVHASNSAHPVVPAFTATGSISPALFDRESWSSVLNHAALWRTENRQSTAELLRGFFRFYSRRVPLLSNVIRTHCGEAVNTVEFFRRSWQGYLADKRAESPSDEKNSGPEGDEGDTPDDPPNMPRTNALYVYDPFLPTYNTAKNLSISKAVELHAKLTAAARLFEEGYEKVSLCTLLGLEASVAAQAALAAEAAAAAAKAAADSAAAVAAAAVLADPVKAAQEAVAREENRYRHQQLDYQQKQVEYDADEFVWSFVLTLGYLKKRSLIEALYKEPAVSKAIQQHLLVACKFILAVLRDVYCFDTIKMRKNNNESGIAGIAAADDADLYAELNEFLTQNKNRMPVGGDMKSYYNIMSLMPTVRVAARGDKLAAEAATENGPKTETTNNNAENYAADNNVAFEELVGLRHLLSVECTGSLALWLPSVRSSKLLSSPAGAVAAAETKTKAMDRPLTSKEMAFEREVQITKATQNGIVSSLLAHANVRAKIDVMSNFDTLLVQVSSLASGGNGKPKQQQPPAVVGNSPQQTDKIIELARHLRMLCFDFVV